MYKLEALRSAGSEGGGDVEVAGEWEKQKVENRRKRTPQSDRQVKTETRPDKRKRDERDWCLINREWACREPIPGCVMHLKIGRLVPPWPQTRGQDLTQPKPNSSAVLRGGGSNSRRPAFSLVARRGRTRWPGARIHDDVGRKGPATETRLRQRPGATNLFAARQCQWDAGSEVGPNEGPMSWS